VAITFDRLNAVDSRSGEFKITQIHKIDKVVPRALLALAGALATI
jgi:hypothetical protein